MTSRSRQPDRNGLADIADGSHRQRVEPYVALSPLRHDPTGCAPPMAPGRRVQCL